MHCIYPFTYHWPDTQWSCKLFFYILQEFKRAWEVNRSTTDKLPDTMDKWIVKNCRMINIVEDNELRHYKNEKWLSILFFIFLIKSIPLFFPYLAVDHWFVMHWKTTTEVKCFTYCYCFRRYVDVSKLSLLHSFPCSYYLLSYYFDDYDNTKASPLSTKVSFRAWVCRSLWSALFKTALSAKGTLFCLVFLFC